MPIRTMLKGKSISTYPINGVYETVIMDKYGQTIKSKVTTSESEAQRMHEHLVSDARQM